VVRVHGVHPYPSGFVLSKYSPASNLLEDLLALADERTG
jgi:hypothetical protein